MPLTVDPREELAVTRFRTWMQRAWQAMRSDARQTMIAAGVGFGVSLALNIWIMGAANDGYRTPVGTPVTGAGNEFQGSIFYLLASALISAVICYRIAAGPERFARELRNLPGDIWRALTADGDQTVAHVLTGVATSLIVVLIVGPSTALILAAASLLAFSPVLGPIVTGWLLRAYRLVVDRVAPARKGQPATIALLVGVVGSSAGFAAGWILPGGLELRFLLALAAIAAVVYISRRGHPGTSGTLLFALSAGALAAWFGDAAIVLADDGGFRECGNPGLAQWLAACQGSGTLIGTSLIGAGAGAAGAAAGSAIGTTAAEVDTDGDGWLDDGTGPVTGTGTEDGTGKGPDGEKQKPSGPNPFDLDKIKIEDIDWDLMPAEMRERLRTQLIHAWREKNPGADYIRQQEAGQQIDAMLSKDGPIKQWMQEAWEYTKDSAAFTWQDFKDGSALMSIIGSAEGILEGLKTGAIGLKDMIVNAPGMVGVSIEFWLQQNPVESVRQIVGEIPGMSKDMANQFLGLMGEINQAAQAGDNQRVGQLLGKIAGQAEFEILMGAGALKATTMGREALQGTRLGKAVEAAEDFVHGPRKGGVAIDNPSATRRPAGEDITVRELEKDFGYDSFTGEFLDVKAKQHGVTLEMKPANPESLNMIKNGEALAKPESLKPKTTNPYDIELGAPPGSEGKVSFFEPKKPAGFDKLPSDHPLVERYQTRADQWKKYQNDMTELQKPPSQRSPEFQDAMRRQYGEDIPLEIEIKNGVVFDKTTGKPFTGDYDIWAVRDAKTGELVDLARAQQVYDDLGYAFNPQHGPGTAHWQPSDPYLQKLKVQLEWEHNPANPNSANLLQFDGSGLPKTAWGAGPTP